MGTKNLKLDCLLHIEDSWRIQIKRQYGSAINYHSLDYNGDRESQSVVEMTRKEIINKEEQK